MEIPLTATALNKRNGITVIGSVGDPEAIVTINLTDDSTVQPNVDENGSFIAQLERKKALGEIKVVAMLRDDVNSRTETILHTVAQKPIVTAVLSTQGIMRKLTGSVNQPGLFIEVHTPENAHPIEVLVDDNFEFELQIPIALRPEDIRVTALNPLTGEHLEVPVELGVTTKTMTIPILTDEMITSYAAEAEHRRAAEEAHDQALMEKVAASEAFVTSIVETLQPPASEEIVEPESNASEADLSEPETATSAAPVFKPEEQVVVETLEPVEDETATETEAVEEDSTSEADATEDSKAEVVEDSQAEATAEPATEATEEVEASQAEETDDTTQVHSRSERKEKRGIGAFFRWLFVRN
ncbi:MAG: hypothetical protein LBT37_03285 [Lactobacillaceae bacterium]|jgi:hypothetical protein|nr:hypothetical protein [Lactobacillaceae bacterium]